MRLTNAVLVLQNSRTEHRKKPCNKKDAPLDLARNVHKVNDKDKVTFVSPSEVWSSPAPPSKKPEEREFVVDCGASMHMLSMEALNAMELETIWESRNSATAITANGKVQTNGEATAYVHDLELFVTVQILEDTPAILGPAVRRARIFIRVGQWSKTTVNQKWQKNPVQHRTCADCCPRLVDRFFQLECKYVFHIVSVDTSDDTSSSPATSRSDDTSIPASGYQSRNPTKKPTTKIQIGTSYQHRETGCEVCQTGYRSSHII